MAIIIFLVFWFSREKEIQYITEKVQKTDLMQTVSVSGEVVSDSEINLDFELSGRVKKVVSVGKEISAGEMVAEIEDEILRREAEKARLALETAKAQSGMDDDRVKEFEQAVSSAEDYLDEVEDLEDQKLEAFEADYEKAGDYYADVLDYYNDVVKTSGEDSQEAKYAKITLSSAQRSKTSAEEAVETARKGRAVSIVSAENSLKSARLQLESAQSDSVDVVNNSAVEIARKNYENALDNLEKTTLLSPTNGIITKINYRAGEVLGSAGLGNSFGKMISYDFLLEADVPEADIAKIKLSQSAEVVFDALSEEEVFSAKVIEIEPASSAIQDVVYYKIKLKIDEIDSRIRSGMSSDVKIRISEKKNVLAVSQRAVKSSNGDKMVEVMDEKGKISSVKVDVGIRGDDGKVEIVSGVFEGMEAIVAEK